ncbi:hypothetical protein [Ruegeria hyattellae]|uniref:hypothetical protein n=1 Tax=Ruegeria hyattellae TaxID=3233337 RepID=UPI00355B8D3B
MLHDLRFPFASGVTQNQISQTLSHAADLVATGPKDWTWLDLDNAGGSRRGAGLTRDNSMSGASVLGSLNLKGRALTLSVSSAARAERSEALILEMLGDLVKPPLTAIQTGEQMMSDDNRDSESMAEDDIPPALARQIAHEHLDHLYRDTLDQPMPALEGKTPRKAVRSAKGK